MNIVPISLFIVLASIYISDICELYLSSFFRTSTAFGGPGFGPQFPPPGPRYPLSQQV